MRLSANGIWVDQDYQSSTEVRVIDFLGDEYFYAVRESPNLGSFMSIGPDLILVHENQALRVKSELGPATP